MTSSVGCSLITSKLVKIYYTSRYCSWVSLKVHSNITSIFNFTCCNHGTEYCVVVVILGQAATRVDNNDVYYNVIIYSTGNTEQIEMALNNNFQTATESDYFTKEVISGQTANVVQIGIPGPQFTEVELAIMGLSSAVALVILVSGVILACWGRCSFITSVVFVGAFFTIGVAGSLTYFAVAGSIQWIIAGSVSAAVFVIFIFISLSTGFCNT